MSSYVAAVPVWVRAVAAVVAIPALWAAELWAGLMLAPGPELIFGGVASIADSWLAAALPVLIGAAVLWIVAKTPFVALSWALSSERYIENEEVQTSE